MSYTPTNWQTGDVVTADKLNKIENGVANGGGVLILESNISENTIELNASYNDIKEAVLSGKNIFIEQTVTSASGTALATTSFYIQTLLEVPEVNYYGFMFGTTISVDGALTEFKSTFATQDTDANIVLNMEDTPNTPVPDAS